MLSFDIHKSFKSRQGQTKISCKGNFLRGEVTALYGKSGSGKTTILRMLAGLDQPVSGTIRFDDKMWFDEHNFVPLTDRSVGMVFQDFNLFKNMTVHKNLSFAAGGKLPEEIKKIADSLGLNELFQRYPQELSKGQQQKVAILRSMCVQSDVLLLDEPFSALDDESILEIIDLINELIKDLVPIVILVTHRKDVILKMAQSVILIEEGTQGKPERLLKKSF